MDQLIFELIIIPIFFKKNLCAVKTITILFRPGRMQSYNTQTRKTRYCHVSASLFHVTVDTCVVGKFLGFNTLSLGLFTLSSLQRLLKNTTQYSGLNNKNTKQIRTSLAYYLALILKPYRES